jgi:hypothetical protein
MLPPPPWRDLPWGRKVLQTLLAASVFTFGFALAVSRRGLVGLIFTVVAVIATMALLYPRQRKARHNHRRWKRSEPARLGADGIALGEDDFVRYREIAALNRVGDRLLLDVGRSDPLVLAISPDDWMNAEAAIERGRQGRLRVAADTALEAMLRRGSESEAAWHARIDTLRTRVAYRTVELDRPSLWLVAQDVDADASARVAACTLLSRVVEPKERAAILSMRADTAHPGLRVALEAMETEGEGVERVASAPGAKSRDARAAR